MSHREIAHSPPRDVTPALQLYCISTAATAPTLEWKISSLLMEIQHSKSISSVKSRGLPLFSSYVSMIHFFLTYFSSYNGNYYKAMSGFSGFRVSQSKSPLGWETH